jgi:hypothetical protein
VRFTVRRLMIAVGAVGLVLGVYASYESRSERFFALMISHQLRGNALIDNAQPGADRATQRRRNTRIAWHEVMSVKYEYAARHPWLPVSPDPPEPQ